MLGKWNVSGNNWRLSQKVIDKVKPDSPLKNKIEVSQKKLQIQITKLESIHEKLQRKHDYVFTKIVSAQKSRNNGYARAYAIELNEIRKMKNMVGGAKLAMEQVQIRLNTVSELGDVIVTLSPCMSIIKGLTASLGGMMPEANTYMQDLSKMLGDVVAGASVNGGDLLIARDQENSDTVAILEEAHKIIEGQTKANIPDVPLTGSQILTQKKETAII